MSSVLFDAPGPAARARHRVVGVVAVLAFVGLLGYIAWRLWESEMITPDAWEPFTDVEILSGIMEGLGQTLAAAVFAIILALIFGALFAAGRLSHHLIVRLPCVVVVEFFRAVPLVLLILAIYLGFGDTTQRFGALIIALMLYNGSVLAEVFRAGINAVPKGQSEAAYAIGLRHGQVLRLVLAPQAVRVMLPAIISQCVVALKDTALGLVIGAPQLSSVMKDIYSGYDNPITTGLVAATVYVVINYALSKLAEWLESRQRRRGRAVVTEVLATAGMASTGTAAPTEPAEAPVVGEPTDDVDGSSNDHDSGDHNG